MSIKDLVAKRQKKVLSGGQPHGDSVDYRALMGGSYDHFLRRANQVLLLREPDTNGYRDHLAHMLQNKNDRIYELGLIRYSKEGIHHAVPVKGLFWRYSFRRIKNVLFFVPVAGYFLRWSVSILLLPRKLDTLFRVNCQMDYSRELLRDEFFKESESIKNELHEGLNRVRDEIHNEIKGEITAIIKKIRAETRRELDELEGRATARSNEVQAEMQQRLNESEDRTNASVAEVWAGAQQRLEELAGWIGGLGSRADHLENMVSALQEKSAHFSTILNQNQLAAFLLEEIYRTKYDDPLADLMADNRPRVPGEKEVSIVYICDNNYTVPTGVSIMSAYCNKNRETNYHFYIIGIGLKGDSIKMLKSISPDITVITIEKNKYQNYDFHHHYVSKAALYKFDLPGILSHLDTVLYLDCDMLVFKDLGTLFATDLTRLYAAVVKDMAAMMAGHHVKIGHENYFNSGMMLLNLRKMREDGISEKLLNNKTNEHWHHFMDQDAFNCTFNEQVTYLSPDYNYMYGNLTACASDSASICAFYGVSEEELSGIEKTPAILHLTNAVKPWKDQTAQKYEQYKKYEILENVYLTMAASKKTDF